MRRLLLVVLILVVFLLGHSSATMAYEKEIKNLSSTIVENLSRGGKKTVAVVDFTDLQGNVTELGRFIAEEFSVALAGAGGGFEVIDRTHLKTILKEQKLAVTDIMDPSTARKLGQIAGADALITGTITPFGESVRVTVKILDTATAKIVGASSGDIAKTKAIEELLSRGIETVPYGEASRENGLSIKQHARTDGKDMPSFQNDFLKITVKSLKKIGQNIELSLLYENLTEKNIKISLYEIGDEYLVDENGEQWKLNKIENIYKSFSRGAYDFPPKLSKIVKLSFYNKDNSNGTIYHAVLDHVGDQSTAYKFQVMIRDIPLTKGGYSPSIVPKHNLK